MCATHVKFMLVVIKGNYARNSRFYIRIKTSVGLGNRPFCCRCGRRVWLSRFSRCSGRLVLTQGRVVRSVRSVHRQRSYNHLHAEGRFVCRGEHLHRSITTSLRLHGYVTHLLLHAAAGGCQKSLPSARNRR